MSTWTDHSDANHRIETLPGQPAIEMGKTVRSKHGKHASNGRWHASEVPVSGAQFACLMNGIAAAKLGFEQIRAAL